MSRLKQLRKAMENASAKMDFEEAGRLRDLIRLLSITSGEEQADDIDPSGLVRQKPGAMGLGTNQPRTSPPQGWVRPNKPDPLTANRSRRSRKKDPR